MMEMPVALFRQQLTRLLLFAFLFLVEFCLIFSRAYIYLTHCIRIFIMIILIVPFVHGSKNTTSTEIIFLQDVLESGCFWFSLDIEEMFSQWCMHRHVSGVSSAILYCIVQGLNTEHLCSSVKLNVKGYILFR